jgi:dipeptidyl aminopeptidase/acylaminoacyl peptidase
MGLTKALSGLIAVLVILAAFSGCGSKAGKFAESEVSFQTEDSYIVGNLTIPDGSGPFPAVIVLAGSGPFDRNGDVDPRSTEDLKLSSTYKDMAYALVQEGFVTLRYDKRGVGDSTGEGGDLPEPSLRDLKAAVAFLKDNPSVDPERIALVGHSIGGLWALMEAAGNDSIAAVCVMATPAKPMSEVLIEQIDWLVKSQGGNDTDVAMVVAQQRAIYDQLRSGELDLSPMSPSQRYEYEYVKAIMDISGAYYAKKIKCPALILQGEKDLFTNIPQESQLLADAFLQGGNNNVQLITFANLDHMFRPTPGQPSPQLYYQDRGPISPNVVKAIADWMKTTLR